MHDEPKVSVAPSSELGQRDGVSRRSEGIQNLALVGQATIREVWPTVGGRVEGCRKPKRPSSPGISSSVSKLGRKPKKSPREAAMSPPIYRQGQESSSPFADRRGDLADLPGAVRPRVAGVWRQRRDRASLHLIRRPG